jgi:hypothetical protein
VKTTLISLAFVLSSLASAPTITLGVYDIAQTMTGKTLAHEEVFVDQRSAKGCVGTNKQSVYDFATAAWAKGRTPIISIEPFSGDPLDEIVSSKKLFAPPRACVPANIEFVFASSCRTNFTASSPVFERVMGSSRLSAGSSES